MGADLIVTALEIERGKQPDFDAARRHLEGMSEKDCLNAYMDTVSIDDPSDVNEEVNPRVFLETAFRDVRDGWSGELRGMTTLALSKTYVLIAGDMSWGDMPEGCDAISAFYQSGMAKAAGFIVDAEIAPGGMDG